jgi:energy-coupling factor transport system permease protein
MIELSRNITFGQYINNDSALTKMDPRAKLLCAILLIGCVSYINSFLGFAICFLFCIAIQYVSHISTRYVLRSYRPFLGFLAFIYIIQILFYVPPDAHQTIYWHWWILSIAKEGILISTITIIRVLLLYYLVSMLMFTTSMVDLTDGLEALLSPLQKIGLPVNAFIMVLVIALKFVPIFVTEVERLIKAQTARGVRFDQGNFIQRTLKVVPLFIPLFISGFKRAQVLSIAMEARCYGVRPGWKRSKRRALKMERTDFYFLIGTVVLCSVVILVNIFVAL